MISSGTPSRQTQCFIAFKDLIEGDRFYFQHDNKKTVYEVQELKPFFTYKMDNEKHPRNARPSDFNKQVFLLRNSKSN